LEFEFAPFRAPHSKWQSGLRVRRQHTMRLVLRKASCTLQLSLHYSRWIRHSGHRGTNPPNWALRRKSSSPERAPWLEVLSWVLVGAGGCSDAGPELLLDQGSPQRVDLSPVTPAHQWCRRRWYRLIPAQPLRASSHSMTRRLRRRCRHRSELLPPQRVHRPQVVMHCRQRFSPFGKSRQVEIPDLLWVRW
jgi:hypothetical protein